jgi:hypothetical protein
MAAAGLGWKGYDEWEDPAEILAPREPEPAAERAADPQERAAQVAAFLASIR